MQCRAIMGFNFGWSYLRKYPEFADARLINLMVLYSGNMS